MHQLKDGTWENPTVIVADPNQSIPRLVFERAKRDPHQVIAERRLGGRWQEVRAEEFTDLVQDLARGFHALGIRKGDKVALLAPTSYLWAAFDVAVLAIGAVTVPIYETDSAKQIAHILKDAEVRAVITQTRNQADLVDRVKTRRVKDILSIDQGAEQKLVAKGQEVPPQVVTEAYDSLTLADDATIVYTSGTTGLPKGVVLTEGNFVEGALQAYEFLPELINDPRSRTLLFLPVAHVLARFVMHAILIGQGRLGFSPDVKHLVDDIQTFKPTLMLAVPRVLEKVYNTAVQKAGSGVKRALFSWSAQQARTLSAATAYPKGTKQKGLSAPGGVTPPTPKTSPGPGVLLKARHRVADALVLKKVRAILGPHLQTIICGGAPLSDDLADFYRGLGITLLQGYGLTETAGPITVQRPHDNPPGSVGYLWPGNSMRLAEDGELLVKGISVSSGYHNLPDATNSSFEDGWFHTGDLASIDEEGRLSITGRKKELIVTAGGKNVSPEVLQDSLASHPLIGQVIVVGDDRPYIGALVTLDPEMLPGWLRNKGLPVVPAARAAELPEVRQSLEKAMERANQNVSRAESIRRFRILPDDLSVENGYLTPSLKLRRGKVLKDFAPEITQLYEMPEEELSKTGASINSSATEEAAS